MTGTAWAPEEWTFYGDGFCVRHHRLGVREGTREN